MGRPRKQVENQKEEDDQEMDVDAEIEIEKETKEMKKKCSSNFSGVKDVKGNIVKESIPTKLEYGHKDATVSAIAVEMLQRTERYGSCFYIDGHALDIVEIAGKISQKPNVFNNRVTFCLCDECVNATLNSVLCTFWKVNNDHFEKHVQLLSSKYIRVYGVLDFSDSRVILNVYSIQVANSAELTYHALLVRYHTMKRAEVGNQDSSVEMLPISKNFNNVNISPFATTVGSPVQTKITMVDQHRFDVSPASVKQFQSDMTTTKSKRVYFEKVQEILQSDTEWRLFDIMSWFKDGMFVLPAMQDLKLIMQILLNDRKIVETEHDFFKWI